MDQYCIAILPPVNVVEYLAHLAEAIRLRYGVETSEKPYKVTLINPFHCGQEQINSLCNEIAIIAQNYHEHITVIDGYTVNKKKGSVFLKLSDPGVIPALQSYILGMMQVKAPNIKLITNSKYTPLLCLAREQLTHQQANIFAREIAETRLNIPWYVSNITVMKRVNYSWQTYRLIPLNDGSFTHTFTIEDMGKDFTFHFKPVYNDITHETNYMVTYKGNHFLMAYDNPRMQFVVVRPAPYAAYELEDELSAAITSRTL